MLRFFQLEPKTSSLQIEVLSQRCGPGRQTVEDDSRPSPGPDLAPGHILTWLRQQKIPGASSEQIRNKGTLVVFFGIYCLETVSIVFEIIIKLSSVNNFPKHHKYQNRNI